uniref:Protein PHLOEM PROTEIN 2-LIKE A1-like n=1 Tax=Ananas comosus var. bracteatus TaxID=296719 RepID=A0A6V7NKL3_ANACO|nr:unnamed protein product [Ananas comosus var. bracteatus]
MAGCTVSRMRPPTEPEPTKASPHKFAIITNEADSSINLEERMYTGIFLKRKRRKYWVEKDTNYNCFMLFARDLSITWSEDPKYWCWLTQKETSGEEIEVASLLNVCWLEIIGKFEVPYLTPGVTYVVAFIVMMNDEAYGWSTPVKLRLKSPDGSVQQREESMEEKPRGKSLMLQVGEFTTKAEQEGEMEISLFEYEDGSWKRGLTVIGVIIHPK